MKLPNAQQAYIDIRKLEDYCLNDEHPRGKDKAIVFKSALGVTRIHSLILKNEILGKVGEFEASERDSDEYGRRFSVTMDLTICTGENKLDYTNRWNLSEINELLHLYKMKNDKTINLLDVVALLHDIPEKKLVFGQVGTVVEELGNNFFEVEFADTKGETIAELALSADELMRLHYERKLA